MINFFSRSNFKFDKKRLKAEILEYLKKLQIEENKNLNIIIAGKRKIKAINCKYRKENLAVPVLSFSYLNDNQNNNLENNMLGEVFICYPLAVIMAAQKEKEVDSILIELIKHGINNILIS